MPTIITSIEVTGEGYPVDERYRRFLDSYMKYRGTGFDSLLIRQLRWVLKVIHEWDLEDDDLMRVAAAAVIAEYRDEMQAALMMPGISGIARVSSHEEAEAFRDKLRREVCDLVAKWFVRQQHPLARFQRGKKEASDMFFSILKTQYGSLCINSSSDGPPA